MLRLRAGIGGVREEPDLAGGLTEAGEKHRGFRELLDTMGDDVHQVSPEWKDVRFSRRTGGKPGIREMSNPRSQQSLLAVPARYELLKGRVVLGIQTINRKRTLAQPDAPRPLILELVNKGCP